VRAALGIRPLLPALLDPSPDKRRAAATALGLSGDESAIGHLKPLLADPDGRVAAAAVTALQNLGAREACPEIERLCNHPDTVLAVTAIGALAALGSRALPRLACERLRLEAERNADAARRILAELHGVRSSEVGEVATRLLSHPSYEVRLEAALRAAEADKVEALPVLALLLYEPSALVRDSAQCGCAALAPLHAFSWATCLYFATSVVIYIAWRDVGGHLYFQGLG